MRFSHCVFLLILFLMSCDKAYDAERIAGHYCDCMKRNEAVKDFAKASQICGKLIAENRYIKLWTVDMRYRELDKLITNDTRDSVILFMIGFADYTKAHCCKETLECPR